MFNILQTEIWDFSFLEFFWHPWMLNGEYRPGLTGLEGNLDVENDHSQDELTAKLFIPFLVTRCLTGTHLSRQELVS